MAMPDRDTSYNADGRRRDLYATESNSSAGWVIGGIMVVALIIIAYFVFAGRPTAPADVNVNSTPAITAPATPVTPAPSANTTAPSANTTPMISAPATPAPATATPATPAPATTPSAPAASGSTPAPPAAPATGQ